MFLRAASLFLLILSLPLPLAAEPVLRCNGPSGGHTGAEKVCTALRPMLGGKSGEVTVELTRDEPTALAARLNWSIAGKSGRGPVVDVTTSDRPLDRRAAERLARGLIAVSDLP